MDTPNLPYIKGNEGARASGYSSQASSLGRPEASPGKAPQNDGLSAPDQLPRWSDVGNDSEDGILDLLLGTSDDLSLHGSTPDRGRGAPMECEVTLQPPSSDPDTSPQHNILSLSPSLPAIQPMSLSDPLQNSQTPGDQAGTSGISPPKRRKAKGRRPKKGKKGAAGHPYKGGEGKVSDPSPKVAGAKKKGKRQNKGQPQPLKVVKVPGKGHKEVRSIDRDLTITIPGRTLPPKRSYVPNQSQMSFHVLH